jgi:eukaryotic-like serine/threonine-protein kinase
MAEPYCIGQVPQARAHLERALELLPQVRGEHWLKGLLWTLWGELMALEGELEPMHQRLAGPVAEARERGDLNALVGLQVGYPTLGWLARGEPEQGRQVAEAALAAWPAGRWFVQHFKHLQALSYVDLYEGRGEAVLRRLEQHLGAARRALPITAVRCVSLDLRSRALLLEAGGRQGSEARRLLRAAEADAQRLEREGMAYTRVQALLVRAGVARQRGQAEQALSVYTQAAEEARAQGLRLYAQVARWREAELRGGEERRSRLATLSEQLRAQGLQRPEAMVTLYCPGPVPLNQ